MNDHRATVLVIEDDAPTRTFLADNLTADGFDVIVAESGRHAMHMLEHREPDVALVDVGLPDRSGLDVVAAVRTADPLATRIDPGLPIIVVSGRAAELDRIRGLARGADDYVCKPFSYIELRARVDAVLRRAELRARRGRLRVGDLVIDPVSREARLREKPIDLSAKEFALLRALATDPTRVFTKEELLRDVWGFRSLGRTRTVDSHASRLRRKLGTEGDRFVMNVWGVGYRLVDPVIREQAAA